jgi:hypothetical protein
LFFVIFEWQILQEGCRKREGFRFFFFFLCNVSIAVFILARWPDDLFLDLFTIKGAEQRAEK